MVKNYLIIILIFLFPFTATANESEPITNGRKNLKKHNLTKAKEVKSNIRTKPFDFSETLNALQVFKHDSVSDVFLPVAINGFDESLKKKLGGFDPVRFTMKSNSDSIVIGKEIEIKISAEYIEVNPQLIFSFEGSHEFTLKVVMPNGFIVTGGSYYDYIHDKVDKYDNKKEFVIKGYFESDLDKCFTLLRSHKNATVNDLYVKKGDLVFTL